MFSVRHGSAAIVIVRTMLQSLGLQSLRSVPHGRIFIGFNEHLCYADTVNWEMITGRSGAARLKMNGQECGMSQITQLYKPQIWLLLTTVRVYKLYLQNIHCWRPSCVNVGVWCHCV